MPNVINKNPRYPDIFLGATEQAGTFKNEKGEEVKYHYFLLDIALGNRKSNAGTVSCCGCASLGVVKTYVDENVRFSDKRKVKAEDIQSIFGVPIYSAADLEAKVLQNCEVLWDMDGNIKRILFEEPIKQGVK